MWGWHNSVHNTWVLHHHQCFPEKWRLSAHSGDWLNTILLTGCFLSPVLYPHFPLSVLCTTPNFHSNPFLGVNFYRNTSWHRCKGKHVSTATEGHKNHHPRHQMTQIQVLCSNSGTSIMRLSTSLNLSFLLVKMKMMIIFAS